MTDDASDGWGAVSLEGDPQMILGRRKGARQIEAVVVSLHHELFSDLRSVCEVFTDSIMETASRPYEPNAAIDRDDQHFVLELDELPTQPEPARRRATDDASEENPDRTAALVRTLRTPGALEQISAHKLSGFRAIFYSIAFQQASGDWAHFLKKTNPRRLFKPGLMWTKYGSTLRKVEAPDMVFESDVDVVLTGDRLASFSGIVIKDLFTDVHLAVRDVPLYVERISNLLGGEMPIEEAAREVLSAAASKKVSFARRLFVLQQALRGVDIKPDRVRDVLSSHGIDHGLLLNGDSFSFEESSVGLFIDVLEGRFFESDWNGEPRRADRFSTRVALAP